MPKQRPATDRDAGNGGCEYCEHPFNRPEESFACPYCGQTWSPAATASPQATTPQQQMADAIRRVTATIEQRIKSGQRSSRIDAHDLVEALLTIAEPRTGGADR